MHQHATKPACYATERKELAPRFRDKGTICYTTKAEIDKLTPGCRGCARIREDQLEEMTE